MTDILHELPDFDEASSSQIPAWTSGISTDHEHWRRDIFSVQSDSGCFDEFCCHACSCHGLVSISISASREYARPAGVRIGESIYVRRTLCDVSAQEDS